MPEVTVVNGQRQEVGRINLPDATFAYPFKRHLLFEAVRHFLACARAGTHKTKNRVDVSGGGKKPWKQKGTGRARVGSTRSPLWRHGGTIFGPVPRDYSYRFPRTARRRALASVLSEKLRLGKLTVVESFDVPTPKTKALQSYVQKSLGLQGKVLLIFDGDNDNLSLAARNHAQIAAVRVLNLHSYHVLNYDNVVISQSSAALLGEVLAR